MTNEAPKADLTVGLAWALFVFFLILKLTHVIAWSWWWVLAPLWVPLGVAAISVIFLVVVILLGGMDCIDF